MKKVLLSLTLSLLIGSYGLAQHFTYNNDPGAAGFTVSQSDEQQIQVSYTIHEWSLTDISINRESVKKVSLPGHFLPNDEGAPDLPGKGRYIAIPQGATAHLNIISSQVETFSGVDISPAPRIPFANEDGPLEYSKDEDIWNMDAFYPANPVTLSATEQIRGLDVVMLGITPFQYNPVSRELKVYHDLQVEVIFEGGSGQFGDDRLRSRWWDPMLKDMVMNPGVIGDISYTVSNTGNRNVGCEYLIIIPDHADFQAWADTLKTFRNRQGILTDVVTTSEIGGNTVAQIETYINDAFDTWDIVPSAILLMGDYGSSGATIISPIWDSYCASDNIFSDVTGN